MLARDQRRRDRAKAAQKWARKRWLEQCGKWAACPNSGHEPAYSELLGDNLLEVVRETLLVCYKCRSAWRVQTNFRHP